MNENRNVIWIAVVGVVIALMAAYLFTRPQSPPSVITSAPPITLPADTPPLAPAVPVLPPDPNADSAPPPVSAPAPEVAPAPDAPAAAPAER